MSQAFQVRSLRLGDTAIQEGVHMAADEAQLRKTLADQGHTVLSVKGKTTGPALRSIWSRSTLTTSRAAFALFCREVRTLIHAGMTVVEAVDTLSARERLEGTPQSLAGALLDRLQQGLSLSSALEELPDTPPVLLAAVRAGERTSNLMEALDDYLKFDGLITQLRKKIVSAAIYPALVSTVGLGISLFLLLVVMPNFASMYENLRNSSAQTATLTIQVSQFVGQHRNGVLAGLAASALGLFAWIRSGLAQQHAQALAQAIPWIRRRVEDFQLAMMYQALALLLKGGYPMTEAMRVAGLSALSDQLRASLLSALEQIERGGSVSQALAQAKLCDEVGRRLMAAAERNGQFYLATQVVSKLHGERFELFVERLTRIAEPLLLLAVALVVGSIVVMMYLPVFDMATQLH